MLDIVYIVPYCGRRQIVVVHKEFKYFKAVLQIRLECRKMVINEWWNE